MDRNADGDLPMAQRMPSRRLSISDNAFNKLILQPENVARTKPDKSLGNPTPMLVYTSQPPPPPLFPDQRS